MAFAKITKGWHVLYVGGNGETTYGLEVTALCTLEESKRGGRQHTWQINDTSFMRDKGRFMENYGLSEDRYKELLDELLELK